MFGFNKTKRSSPRIKITGQARMIKNTSTPGKRIEEACRISDICINGSSVVSEGDLDFDFDYEMFISLYPNVEFRVICRVLWKEISGGVKTYGVKFEKLDLANRLKLQQMVLANIEA